MPHCGPSQPYEEDVVRFPGPRLVSDHETRALVSVETMDRLAGLALEALLRGDLAAASALLTGIREVASDRMAASVDTEALAAHVRRTAESRLATRVGVLTAG
jgi:hypothetical protein